MDDPIDELGDLDVVPDDQLRLMFLCCHPALAPDVAGVADPAAPRRSRDRRGGRARSSCPRPPWPSAWCGRSARSATTASRTASRRPSSWPSACGPSWAAIYLIFNEGHTAFSGDDLVRTELAAEAIRLGRVLVDLLPDEPEAGRVARAHAPHTRGATARVAPDGSLVRLADQDRSRWDRTAIAEGHAIVRACLRRNEPGAYQVQAAIAAVHADATTAPATEWRQIVALYDQLYALRPDDGRLVEPLGRRGRARRPAGRSRRARPPCSSTATTSCTRTRAELHARLGQWGGTPRGVRPGAGAGDQRDRAAVPPRASHRPRPALTRRAGCPGPGGLGSTRRSSSGGVDRAVGVRGQGAGAARVAPRGSTPWPTPRPPPRPS